MKKRYLRFKAWNAPMQLPHAQKIDCIIDITKIENMIKYSKQISIYFNNHTYSYYFSTERHAEMVYDKIWKMLTQQED